VAIAREVYERGHGAAILLHNPKNDNVILVRQFRSPALVNGDDPYLIEVVAGALDGDSPDVCARREAVEEAGVVVRDLRIVCSSYSHSGALTEIVSLFIGTYEDEDRGSGGGLEHEGEDIEVLEVPFADAYDMIEQGKIVDMKTIILLQAMKMERLSV
jgi:nudix-type nucleoside diphosphatase (YffH/AdpP family)